MNIPVINGRQFATKFALQPNQYAWFLGAGASAGAGIPTGYAMIRDFKTRLFCLETKLPSREVDSTDPLWVERIEYFFENNSILPPAGDPTEYAQAFEAVYPSIEDRRSYIDKQVQLGRPSFAHRILASLLITNKAPCVFTTNFDDLVETATTIARNLLTTSDSSNLIVAGIDSADRACRCLQENDWPLLAKIHGDFQSVELKNTEDELQEQDERMRSVLVEACRRFSLIVVGYSGRDASVMSALSDVLNEGNAFPGGIYWVTRSPSELLPAVQGFLERAVESGVSVHLVESQNFDELAGDFFDAVQLDDVLERHIREGQSAPIVTPMPLPSHEALNTPILRCSALRVTSMPKTARRLRLQKSANIFEIRQCLKNAKVQAIVAAAGSEYAAFGSDEEILNALSEFGPELAGTIDLDPVSNSWALGLLYDALTKALCKGRPLNPRLRGRGHSILVSGGHSKEDDDRKRRRLSDLAPLKSAYSDAVFGKVPNLGYPFKEAVAIRLEQCVGKWWCVFDPYTIVDLPMDNPGLYVKGDKSTETSQNRVRRPPNPAGDWLRERWAQRYNKKWNAIIEEWSRMLSGEVRAFWIGDGKGIDAGFNIGSVTAWSRPSHNHAYFHGGRR